MAWSAVDRGHVPLFVALTGGRGEIGSTCACGRISSVPTPDFARGGGKRGSFQIVIRTPRRPHAVTLRFAGSALFLPTTLNRAVC